MKLFVTIQTKGYRSLSAFLLDIDIEILFKPHPSVKILLLLMLLLETQTYEKHCPLAQRCVGASKQRSF